MVVHGFAAMEAVRAKLGDKVRYAQAPLEACQGADALLIATEWADYRDADLEAVARALKAKVLFDGRNLFRPEAMEARQWTYHSLGRRAVVPK